MRTGLTGKLGLGRSVCSALALCALAAVAGCILWSNRSNAEGALAVGLPADVAKQGLAVGYAVNHATKETARAEALKRCRQFKDAPEATRDLCKIEESFRDRCLAIALDPETGTKGIGWAVAKKQDDAEDQAMEACVEQAERKRRDSCRIAYARCDTK